MEKYTIIFIALFLYCCSAKAQLNPSELAKLNPQQKSIYERRTAELKAAIKAAEYELLKAEDIIKMGNEMCNDNAKAAGAAHIARGVALKEKANKAITEAKKEQVLLDQAAREGIKNNEKE
jgi:PBP1b-binding outer membrane lipoprotein LpoB